MDVIAFFARDERGMLHIVGHVDIAAEAVFPCIDDAFLYRREQALRGDRDHRVLSVDLPVPLVHRRVTRALRCALETPGRHRFPTFMCDVLERIRAPASLSKPPITTGGPVLYGCLSCLIRSAGGEYSTQPQVSQAKLGAENGRYSEFMPAIVRRVRKRAPVLEWRLATLKGGDPVRDYQGNTDLQGSNSGSTRSVIEFGR